MIHHDWERFGEEIRRTVQDAVDSGDFRRLNQTVSDTIGTAMENVSRGLKNGGWYRSPVQPQQNKDGQVHGERACRPENSQSLFLRGTSTQVGGIFLAVTGYVFGVGLAVTLIALCIAAGMSSWSTPLIFSAAAAGVFFCVFAWMAGLGTSMACSVGRYRKYVKALAGREYCDIKELARLTGKPWKKVRKDVKKMIRNGWFRQGHLDNQEMCLMVSDTAYRQYTALMERMNREKEEREAAEKRAKEAAERARADYEKLPPEVQKIVEQGDCYVRKIREANDAIPGEEISAKIYRMEILVDRIFDRVEQCPECVDDIRKLMDYYLPTTVKLLDAYEELDRQPVQGENMISSKREIEKTLDTLNVAFEKLLDSLFQDTAWDVSSDISVLNTMLAQEGLTEDDLTK